MSRRNTLAGKKSRAQVRIAKATLSLIRTATIEQTIAWLVHDATDDDRADIANRALAVTEAVADTYAITDDLLKLAISDQVTTAIAVDQSFDDGTGENTAELDRTLERLNRDLGRRRAA